MKFSEFSYSLLIRESHLDTFGHVNNAVYLQILEEARWEIIANRGYSMAQIKKTGLGPIILGVEISFKKELRLRQQVRIKTQGGSYHGKIGTLRQWIEDEQGRNCCEALFTVALFDTNERKMVAPTQEWLYAIGAES